jgi:hypothetical protein
MTRMVEQELDLMNAFEPRFELNGRRASTRTASGGEPSASPADSPQRGSR